jgi:hypothetical protein
MDTLDSVQLWIPIGPGAQLGGSSAINIRQGVNGPILAASSPTHVMPDYTGPVGFRFAQPVHFVPGQVYALEPFQAGTEGFGMFGMTVHYSAGRLFYDGQYHNEAMIFREGVGLPLVPEPSTLVLFGIGTSLVFGLGHARARKRLQLC